MKRLLPVIPFAVLLLAVLYWSQQRSEPYYVSGFIESHQVRVGSRLGGRVAEVHAEEGAPVSRGALLVMLEPYDLRERKAEAEAQSAAREAELKALVAGARPEEIAVARAKRDRAAAALAKAVEGPRAQEVRIAVHRVAKAEADLAKAKKDYARVADLFRNKQAADEEADEATRKLAVAEAQLGQAKDELDLLREGTRAEEIAEARAVLAEAEQTLALLLAGTREEDIDQARALAASARAAVAAIEQQVEELAVRTPFDCVVEAVDLRPGDMIAPNAPIVSLRDPSELWVRAYLPQNRLDVKIDQRVAVRVDAFAPRRFKGHITFIARHAEFTPSNVQTPEERAKQVFRIKVVLDEGLDLLRPGMAADVFLEPPS